MIEDCFQRPHVWRRLQRGPLADVFGQYVEHLQRRGYVRATIQQYVQAVEHFGGWMARHNRVEADVDVDLVTAFLVGHLPRCRCRRQRVRVTVMSRAALRQLLMVQTGRVSQPTAAPDARTVDGVVQSFDQHLAQVCGLALTTRRGYRRQVYALLATRFGRRAVNLAELRSADICDFVTSRAKDLCPASANAVSNAMRAFVRFLLLRGIRTAGVPSAIPRAAVWCLSHVPRVLSDTELAAFFAAFDRTTALGRRDFAIAVCFAYLGLRAGEVAAITLDDIDWRSSTLTVSATKGRRGTQIPLPAQVAMAMADYLRHGRPETFERALFVHHRAPRGCGGDASLARIAMRRAYARAGLDPRLTGTHVLRHTAATRLLRSGASMKEIADVLGHKCLDTSAIYTKVDLNSLQEVPLAWPGGRS